jgi:hypothetical protein
LLFFNNDDNRFYKAVDIKFSAHVPLE